MPYPIFGNALASAQRAMRRRRHRPSPAADAMQRAVDAHVAVSAPAGALVAVAMTPQGTREFCAGHIDGRDSPAPDADTQFEIGSITKTFTATLLASMARKGLVTLDTPLDELLEPDARLGRQSPRPVTLLDLAAHRSGLPRLPWGLPMLAGVLLTPSQPYRMLDESALRRWLRNRQVHNVGAAYCYSNLGYLVLGLVLARRAGLDYASALRRHVLDPLHLSATGLHPHGSCAQPHGALGQRVDAWRRNDDLHGAGGLWSTLADMAAWLRANLDQREPVDAGLHTAIADAATAGARIGLGWQLHGAEPASRVVWHDGATGGSRSFIAFAPAHGVGVVVLSAQGVSVDALGIGLLNEALRIARASSTTG